MDNKILSREDLTQIKSGGVFCWVLAVLSIFINPEF